MLTFHSRALALRRITMMSGRGSNMGVRCHKSDDLGGGSLAEPKKPLE
jgi:hypothetical protein